MKRDATLREPDEDAREAARSIRAMSSRALLSLALLTAAISAGPDRVCAHVASASVRTTARTPGNAHAAAGRAPASLPEPAVHPGAPSQPVAPPASRKSEAAPPALSLPHELVNPLRRRRMAMPVAPSGDYAF